MPFWQRQSIDAICCTFIPAILKECCIQSVPSAKAIDPCAGRCQVRYLRPLSSGSESPQHGMIAFDEALQVCFLRETAGRGFRDRMIGRAKHDGRCHLDRRRGLDHCRSNERGANAATVADA